MRKFMAGLVAAAFLLSAAPAVRAADAFQYSTIASLLTGAYDGQLTIRDLAAEGDFGLGTFDGVDGEMVVVDGKVWRAAADGKAYAAELDRETPFAVLSRFVAHDVVGVPAGLSLAGLESLLNERSGGVERFVAVRVDLPLAALTVRSIPPQSPPYKPLSDVVREQQKTFRHSGVSGTLVGFRFPPSAAGANVPGWHFHFVDDGRTLGGHVLALTTGAGGKAGIQLLDGVRLTFLSGAPSAKDAVLDMVEKGR